MKQPQDEPEPNAILRGGKYEGRKLRADTSYMLGMVEDGNYPVHVYKPTGAADAEFPALAKYVFYHEEHG